MARGTATFAPQSADQARISDLQQKLLAQCELVIRQTEVVAAQSRILSQSVLKGRSVSATNPLPSLRATLETRLGRTAFDTTSASRQTGSL